MLTVEQIMKRHDAARACVAGLGFWIKGSGSQLRCSA